MLYTEYKSVSIRNFGEGWQDAEDGKTYGYYLIDGNLVPHSFLELLFEHAHRNISEYGPIISVEDACGQELWESMS